MKYYPIYLNLQGRSCVVIGGGAVAERKVRGLLEAEAAVTVVSPHLTQALQELAHEGTIVHIARNYRPGDLVGASLAISATDHRTVNEQVWQEATGRNIPVNVVDDPPRCTFIAPAVVRQGDLTVAISTGGKAPALAVRLRQQLERELGAEYARFLDLAGVVRTPLGEQWPDFEQRRRRWYRLVDSDMLALLRQGDEAAARQRLVEIMGVEPAEEAT